MFGVVDGSHLVHARLRMVKTVSRITLSSLVSQPLRQAQVSACCIAAVNLRGLRSLMAEGTMLELPRTRLGLFCQLGFDGNGDLMAAKQACLHDTHHINDCLHRMTSPARSPAPPFPQHLRWLPLPPHAPHRWRQWQVTHTLRALWTVGSSPLRQPQWLRVLPPAQPRTF